eukprot:1155074-Rhodomonas_salina.1
MAEASLSLIHAIADEANASPWSETGQLLVLERCKTDHENRKGWGWCVVAGQAASDAMAVGVEGFPWSPAKLQEVRVGRRKMERRGSGEMRAMVDEFMAEQEEEEASRGRVEWLRA